MKKFDKMRFIALMLIMVFLMGGSIASIGVLLMGGSIAHAASPTTVDLGTAASYGVLAGDSISNTGATTIDWDLGLYPGTSVDGGITVTGTRNVTNAAALAAKKDLRTAYLDAFGRTPDTLIANGELGGQTLTPGVYRDDGDPASLTITGTLYLDALGDPNAVWIFQSASTLTAEVGSHVVLLKSAVPCNVFWQVGSSATLYTGSTFVGTILANTSITAQNSVTVDGRLLAGAQEDGAGAVTLDTNTITRASCAQTPGPTPGPTPVGPGNNGNNGSALEELPYTGK